MATRVTDGARRERPLPRACIALTKSEEKERLLAVYFARDSYQESKPGNEKRKSESKR